MSEESKEESSEIEVPEEALGPEESEESLQDLKEGETLEPEEELEDEDEEEGGGFGGSLKISDKLNIDLGISDLSSM